MNFKFEGKHFMILRDPITDTLGGVVMFNSVLVQIWLKE